MTTKVFVGIPILLMLAMLALFGVTWLFHHHHWRPFVGIFLFVIGLGFFLTFERHTEVPTATTLPPQMGGTLTNSSEAVEAPLNGGSSPAEHAALPPGEAAPPIPHPPLVLQMPPEWLGKPPHFESNNEIYVTTAASGRYATHAECERAIIGAVNEAVGQYVTEYIPEDAGPNVVLDAEYIRSQLVKDWYWESVSASVGQMYQLHARLVFDRHVRDELDGRVREAVVAERLKYSAAGTAAALLLLGGIYSLLNRGASTRP